jgi:hypothetical protein
MFAPRRLIAAVVATAAAVGAPVASAQPGPRPTPVVWTPALPANEGIERLAAFPDGNVFAQSGPGYAHSTDFGANWSFTPGPDGQTGNSGMLDWSSPQTGFAVVSRDAPALVDPVSHTRCDVGLPYFALDVTTDGGTLWLPACTPVAPLHLADRNAPVFSADGLYVSRRDSSILVAGELAPPNCHSLQDIQPMLFMSSDFGRHWRTVSLPRGYMVGLLGQDIYDSRHVVVLASKAKGSCHGYQGSDTYAFASTDGTHFKRVFRCPDNRTCSSSAWVTPDRLIVGLSDGQLFVSNNRGARFFKGALLRDADYDPAIETGQVDPRIFWAQALSFSDARHGFASTRGSGTWRTTDGGLRWVQEKSPECVYYPFGVGDVSAGDSEHGITGGPPSLDVRQPGEVELGCIAPQDGGPQIAGAGRFVASQKLPGTASTTGRIDAFGRSSISYR